MRQVRWQAITLRPCLPASHWIMAYKLVAIASKEHWFILHHQWSLLSNDVTIFATIQLCKLYRAPKTNKNCTNALEKQSYKQEKLSWRMNYKQVHLLSNIMRRDKRWKIILLFTFSCQKIIKWPWLSLIIACWLFA